jgi:peptidoglycan hydrolase-like protein with peptidoglycan-binding domain
MFAFQSTLFQGDQLLQAIADDAPAAGGGLTRISQTQNRNDPAVLKVQLALLDWRPDVLPDHGADGDYGGESARAVHRFKAEELGVPEGEIIDDVGPLTVQRLDAIRAAAEAPAPPPAAVLRLLNQYGEPLAGVAVTAEDGTAGVSDGDGLAALALAAAQGATLEQTSLLAALGDLLERPASAVDVSAAIVVTPSLPSAVWAEPGVQQDVVVVARADVEVALLAPVEGTPRVDGPGVRAAVEGEVVRLALQSAGGLGAVLLLDPPPGGETPVAELPPLDAWLALAPEAVPAWVTAAGEPLPDPPLPQTWAAIAPDAVLAAIHGSGDAAPLHELLAALEAPPAAGPDPAAALEARAEMVGAFLALGPDAGAIGQESASDEQAANEEEA